MAEQYFPENFKEKRTEYRFAYFSQTKDWAKCLEIIKEKVDKGGYENAGYINQIGWSMYEDCSDKKLLTYVLKYMKGLIEKEPIYAYLDTYAALLYKAGQPKEAKIWANKAIETGKKAGEKTESTEELLKKMNAK